MFYQWVIVDGGTMYVYETKDYAKAKGSQAIDSELKEANHLFLGFDYDQEKHLIEVMQESHLPDRIRQLKTEELAQVKIFASRRKKQEIFERQVRQAYLDPHEPI